MFIESVRVSCDFLACCGESAKYQKCLTFYRPSLLLILTLSLQQQACSNHFHSRLYHFQSFPIMKPNLSLSLKSYTAHFCL